MGSTGTGHFSDYPGSAPKSGDDKTGGSSNEDKCLKAFSSFLEDVARCHYFTSHNDVPPAGTEVEIVFNSRLVAVDNKGDEIGYLPTRFNYIKICIDNGHTYSGNVISSSLHPIPSVRIDVIPA